MGIPYALHIACTYAFHGCRHMGCMWYPFTHVQLLREHAYMDTIWNPYGKRICVHTIWASYDNAIGVISRTTGVDSLNFFNFPIGAIINFSILW